MAPAYVWLMIVQVCTRQPMLVCTPVHYGGPFPTAAQCEAEAAGERRGLPTWLVECERRPA